MGISFGGSTFQLSIMDKIPVSFAVEIDKLNLNFIWKCKEARIVKREKRNKVGRITLPDFKLYKAIIIKSERYWHEQYMESRNRSIYDLLILDKRTTGER